jgi:hypothetical protein
MFIASKSYTSLFCSSDDRGALEVAATGIRVHSRRVPAIDADLLVNFTDGDLDL